MFRSYLLSVFEIKKSPDLMTIGPGMPFFILEHNPSLKPRRQTNYDIRVGLLAPGSSYLPRLPVLTDSGILRLSSPVTAAGARRVFTPLPFFYPPCPPPIYKKIIK